MQVMITQQFKRQANPDIEILRHQLSLMHIFGKKMPKGIALIPPDAPIASLITDHKNDNFYTTLLTAHDVEDAFKYYFMGTARYRGLLHDVYKFNPSAVFGKYLKDLSIIKGNTYLDDSVQRQWEAWLKDYESKYAFHSLLDNQQ